MNPSRDDAKNLRTMLKTAMKTPKYILIAGYGKRASVTLRFRLAPWIAAALFIVLLTGSWSAPAGMAQDIVELWPEGAPGAVGEGAEDTPTLAIYLPEASAANGTAVVVCPGGGYAHLAMDHEGRQVAEWLNERGSAAFVLKYRLGPRYGHPSPLLDAQRAIRYVRARASELGVDPSRIGVWGFSAGGHLAATVSTQAAPGAPDAADPLERHSSRPDFTILAYPVITMTESFAHAGSRLHLLGEDFDPDLAEQLSNEKQVTADTPPAFLFHTDDDGPVPADNSVAYYLALRAAGVPAELHVYQSGPHGVGLAPDDPALSSWPDRLEDWLRGMPGE